MNIEQIALFDLYLKSIPKYGLQNIMNINHLIVLEATPAEIQKLKTAAVNLNNVKAYIKSADLEIWEQALKEQIRFSVNRAKELKK